MSDRMIDIEVDKIYHPQASDHQTALVCAWICGYLKGIQLKILNIKKISSLADYFILADARNSIQARSMANEISRQLKRLKLPRLSLEGNKDGDWILLDAKSVIVHIFVEPAREQYNLEALYAHGIPVPIPHEYYTTSKHSLEMEETAAYFSTIT